MNLLLLCVLILFACGDFQLVFVLFLSDLANFAEVAGYATVRKYLSNFVLKYELVNAASVVTLTKGSFLDAELTGSHVFLFLARGDQFELVNCFIEHSGEWT